MSKECSDCAHLKRIRGDYYNPPEVYCKLEDAGECSEETKERFVGRDFDYEEHSSRCQCSICKEDRRQQMLDDPKGFEESFKR